ncbi:unnamed protein product [Meloidogyne enterolobii]|uniref:Uncharacterized protein n=1 Tax=Meloidogyne enterolobii TaxID=390850 RepID=A0ACB0YT58_MELEN
MKSKHQNKKLPNEMLVDIFKATDNTIMENLLPNPNKISSMSKQKEFEKMWINKVNKLLTCSSIVYIFVGKIFKIRWRLREENKELLNILKEFVKREERRRENVFKEEIEEEYVGFKTILKRRKSEGDKDDEYCPCAKRFVLSSQNNEEIKKSRKDE